MIDEASIIAEFEDPHRKNKHQQPKEYIIKESDMMEVCRILSLKGNPQLSQAFESVCRSRPYTAPSTVVEDITFEGAAIVQAARKEAARKAREDVLSGLIGLASNYFETLEDGANRGLPLTSDVEAIPPSKLLEWVESLRSTQQQAGDQHE